MELSTWIDSILAAKKAIKARSLGIMAITKPRSVFAVKKLAASCQIILPNSNEIWSSNTGKANRKEAN